MVSALFLVSSCDSPERHALRQLSREGIQPSGRALVEAITLDEVQHVEWLLDVKVHTEQRDANGHTPLRIAIEQDHPSTALILLESEANPNAKSPDEIDILGISLEKNFPEVVEKLIANGAKADGSMPTGEMMLPWAIRNGRLVSVRSMFKHGADPHITDRDGNPLLHIAIEAGHKDLVKALIEHGADPGATDPNGNSTIALALKNKWIGILPTLAAAGADTNLPSPSGKTLLEQAIEDRDTETIPLLMRIGADPVRRPTTPGGVTPLEAAIASGHPETVRQLLAAGADANKAIVRPVSKDFLKHVSSKDMRWYLAKNRNITPLMLAANTGNLATARYLLDAGAKINTYTRPNYTWPLNFASRRSDVPMMRLLLGQDPAAKKERHIVLSLSEQRARVYDANGDQIFSTKVSSGKRGYRTRQGEFVITDKHRHHNSSIYGSSMPYFQRLSCSDFGFHYGYVPNYAASHGCIRLPMSSAKKLFAMTSVGDTVTFKP